VMVSRHLSRSLGKKIASRVRMSPAAMESTHDLDLVFWLLEPAKPVKVYSQGGYGYMQSVNGSYDVMWSTVTMDDGALVVIGGGWQGRGDRHRGGAELDPDAIIGNARLAAYAIPALRGARLLRGWAGLEAETTDAMPSLGRQ